MSHKAPPKLASHELVHLGVVELVIEELLGHLPPQSRFPGTQGFADVGPISTGIADQISVELPGDGAREAPVHKDGPEDRHAHEVVPC